MDTWHQALWWRRFLLVVAAWPIFPSVPSAAGIQALLLVKEITAEVPAIARFTGTVMITLGTTVAIAVARSKAAFVERCFRGDGRALWADAAVPGLQKKMRVELQLRTSLLRT